MRKVIIKAKKKKAEKKLKRDWLVILGLAIFGILVVIFLVFYFINLLPREKPKKEIEEIPQELIRPQVPEGMERSFLEIQFKLKKFGIERYFLSKIEPFDNSYVPSIHFCLFKEGKPIYPFYLYATWSYLEYPEDAFPPQIALVRYVLLPEDNDQFKLDKSCYIKEIRTERDWKEVEEKYGFFKQRF